MSNLSFNSNEFHTAIKNLVPKHQRELVLSTVNKDKDFDFDEVALILTGESKNTSMIKNTSGTNREQSQSMLEAIKKELYDFICTNSSKYKKERIKAGTSIENTLKVLATALGGIYGVAAAVITGAIVVLLISFAKIGKNAWCELKKP